MHTIRDSYGATRGEAHHFNDLGLKIDFQEGPVKEKGVNGCQNEDLLKILIQRTKILNKAFPCRENALAITKMQEALFWFQHRTANRIEQGVEGKNVNHTS